MKVRAFGVKNSSGAQLATTLESDRHSVEFQHVAATMDFRGADLVLLAADPSFANAQQRASEMLANQVFEEARRGGVICVFYVGPFAHEQYAGYRIVRRIGLQPANESHSPDAYSVVEPAFAEYFSRYAYPAFAFHREDSHAAGVLPIAGRDAGMESMAAFATQIEMGLVYVVPANFNDGSEAKLISSLADAIEEHSAAVLTPRQSPIVRDFTFTAEAGAQETQAELQAKIRAVDEVLTAYAARKDILYLRGHQLADRVPEWITEHFGVPTRRQEEYIEDFWLLNEDGTDAVICDAKALDKNVKRQHIRALALNRDRRDLADDFPALLVANTFANDGTVAKKDTQGVGKLEIENAVKENVLVVRTLDLVRLLDHKDRELIGREDIWKIFTGGPGWLRATSDDWTLER